MQRTDLDDVRLLDLSTCPPSALDLVAQPAGEDHGLAQGVRRADGVDDVRRPQLDAVADDDAVGSSVNEVDATTRTVSLISIASAPASRSSSMPLSRVGGGDRAVGVVDRDA